MFQNIKKTALVLIALLAVSIAALPMPIASALSEGCDNPNPHVLAGSDGKVCCPTTRSSGDATSCFMAKYVNPAIKLLSILAGLAAVVGIVMGGIEYAASGGDPQKTASGKGKIIKAVYGLVSFMFLFAVIQFFSPGGVSGTKPASTTGIAAQCAKPFLGLKPWFAYLPDKSFAPGTCDITEFSLFGTTSYSEGKRVEIPSGITPVVLAIIDDMVRIAGLVAVAYVIIGGIKFTTSNGEPENTKKARETIINALIGVVVAIIAASVVSYIGNKLSK
jgi:hypothetical protein